MVRIWAMYLSLMKRLISLGLSAFTLVAIIASCNSDAGTDRLITVEQKSGAISFLRSNCISCHSVEPGAASIVAPTMIEVRRAYLEKYPEEKDFTANFRAFVLNPSADISVMPEAVGKFGLMPKMGYDERKVEMLAYFLYTTDIAVPGWDAGFTQGEKSDNTPKSNEEILEAGKEIALATKAVLGKNLLQALNEKGPAGAVSFCNTRAIQLTDSMALAMNAGVSRVSDKPRNPGNAASEKEIAVIEGMKAALAAGETAKPVLLELDSAWVGYYPIETNDMCLKCHGVPDEKTKAVLQELYPDDKATGYLVNQVRGAWKIEMARK